eukprot:c13142_g1_i1 orf=535-792(+)
MDPTRFFYTISTALFSPALFPHLADHEKSHCCDCLRHSYELPRGQTTSPRSGSKCINGDGHVPNSWKWAIVGLLAKLTVFARQEA